MTVAEIIAGVLKLLGAVADWLERERFIGLGRAEAQRDQEHNTVTAVDEANAVRDRLRRDDDYARVVRDEFTRD